MASFSSLLLRLSNDIERSELDKMKFCCGDYGIGRKKLEEISEAFKLFEELRKRDLLGPENQDLLLELLEKADRIDLKNEVLNAQAGSPSAEASSSASDSRPAVANQTVSDRHLNEISEDLGRDWKMLGRKLEIPANILENIDEENRKIKEKTFQMMSRWKKRSGNNATGQALSNALVAIGRRDVAEKLADVCRQDGILIHMNEEEAQSSPANNGNRTESGGLNTMQADLAARLPTQESRPQ